jgi:hypothetical protein
VVIWSRRGEKVVQGFLKSDALRAHKPTRPCILPLLFPGDLYPYDAGTDSGRSYTSPDEPTEVREGIFLIEVGPLLVEGRVPALGVFRFTPFARVRQADISLDPTLSMWGE